MYIYIHIYIWWLMYPEIHMKIFLPIKNIWHTPWSIYISFGWSTQKFTFYKKIKKKTNRFTWTRTWAWSLMIHVYVSHHHMYMCHIVICICVTSSYVCVSHHHLYMCHIIIGLLGHAHGRGVWWFLRWPSAWTAGMSHHHMYMCLIIICVCVTSSDVYVSHHHMYVCHIIICMCVTSSYVYVSRWTQNV